MMRQISFAKRIVLFCLTVVGMATGVWADGFNKTCSYHATDTKDNYIWKEVSGNFNLSVKGGRNYTLLHTFEIGGVTWYMYKAEARKGERIDIKVNWSGVNTLYDEGQEGSGPSSYVRIEGSGLNDRSYDGDAANSRKGDASASGWFTPSEHHGHIDEDLGQTIGFDAARIAVNGAAGAIPMHCIALFYVINDSETDNTKEEGWRLVKVDVDDSRNHEQATRISKTENGFSVSASFPKTRESNGGSMHASVSVSNMPKWIPDGGTLKVWKGDVEATYDDDYDDQTRGYRHEPIVSFYYFPNAEIKEDGYGNLDGDYTIYDSVEINHIQNSFCVVHWVIAGPAYLRVIYYYEKSNDGPIASSDTTVVVTTKAEKEEGESKDGPWIPIIIIAGGGGAAAWALNKRRKSKKNKQEQREDEKDDEREESRYRMLVSKNCGDTLRVGDNPVTVAARIEEVFADGSVKSHDELSAQISISGDGYVEVANETLKHGYKAALAYIPAGTKVPDTVQVTFTFTGAGGRFVNHVEFKTVGEAEFVFGQDNLTMPAMYKDELPLQFMIAGLEGTDPTVRVTARVSCIETKPLPVTDNIVLPPEHYKVDVVWNAKDELWQANVQDLWTDAEANKRFHPGDIVRYRIDFEARYGGGQPGSVEHVVKADLPLYRFYMGLAIKLPSNDVPCYYEEYDPVHHESMGAHIVKDGDRELIPAQTRCFLKIYTWDEKTHEIVTIDPVPTDFKVVADDQSQQERIDQLGLRLLVKQTAGGAPYYLLHCCLGVLNAPNRFNVELQVKCIVDGQEITMRRTVRLTSQPRRTFKTLTELTEWQKRNKQMLDILERIDGEIQREQMGDRLAPLVQYIQLQIEAYHSDDEKVFGFDERNFKAIQTTYHHVVEGMQGDAHQNALVACDDLQEVVFEYIKAMRTTVNDMGTFQKLFLSVATFGLFDIATATIEVVGEMKDYVDKGGDSTFGMFCVGAWVVTKTYLTEKAMQTGMNAAKNYVKSGGDLGKAWQATKTDFNKMVESELNSVKTFGRKLQGAENAKAGNQQAGEKADELLGEAKKTPNGPDDISDEMIKKGRERAQKNLKELQDSIDNFKSNPNSEQALLRRNEAIMRCQQDKQTMMMLKGQSNIETVAACNAGVNFGECRKVLNNHLDRSYKMVDNRVQHRLAELTGMKPDEVKLFGATSSDKAKLLSGKSVTFDRDVTYYYIDKATGAKKYFPQSVTERIYAEEFYEVCHLGTNPSGINLSMKTSRDLVRQFAKEMDQTVVEDVLRHAESYGKDLDLMIKKGMQGMKLTDPQKVAEAVLYKGNERFYIAEKMMKAAEKMANPEDKLNHQLTAIGEIIEGCRQQVKVFDLLDARDIARLGTNGASKISTTLREGIAILRKLAVKGTTDLNTAQKALRKLGYSLTDLTAEMYRTVINIG